MSAKGCQELLKYTAEQQLLCATAKPTIQYDVRHAEYNPTANKWKGINRHTSIKAVMEECTSTSEKKKKNHYIFSSQRRADQVPGSPRKGQLVCTPARVPVSQ